MKTGLFAVALAVAFAIAPAVAQQRSLDQGMLGDVAPLAAGDLAATAGRAGLDQDGANNALVQQNNRVGAHSTTGANAITGSLNGNTGITTVFQNSGNNSAFQAATSITVIMR